MDEDITVADIIVEALKQKGFDGLYNPQMQCGCRIPDIMPCEYADASCRPGYYKPGCSDGCGEDCDWHIVKNKPEQGEK